MLISAPILRFHQNFNLSAAILKRELFFYIPNVQLYEGSDILKKTID
jgi:hypothetical protein